MSRKLQALKVLYIWQFMGSIFVVMMIIAVMIMDDKNSLGKTFYVVSVSCVAISFGLTYLFNSLSKAYQLSRRERIIVILTFVLLASVFIYWTCFLPAK